MRVELIGHFQPCMTDIYLHIDARMADYIRTHPYFFLGNRPFFMIRTPALQHVVSQRAVNATRMLMGGHTGTGTVTCSRESC